MTIKIEVGRGSEGERKEGRRRRTVSGQSVRSSLSKRNGMKDASATQREAEQ